MQGNKGLTNIAKEPSVVKPSPQPHVLTPKSVMMKSFAEAPAVVIGAFILGCLSWALASESRPGYMSLMKNFLHHACDATFAFPVVALSVCLICMISVASKPFERWSFGIGQHTAAMLGHLTLAGLGFAISFWIAGYVRWGLIDGLGTAFLWFLSGTACVALGLVMSQSVTDTEKRWLPYMLLLLGALGVAGLWFLVEPAHRTEFVGQTSCAKK
jgi:hypothetical protein